MIVVEADVSPRKQLADVWRTVGVDMGWQLAVNREFTPVLLWPWPDDVRDAAVVVHDNLEFIATVGNDAVCRQLVLPVEFAVNLPVDLVRVESILARRICVPARIQRSRRQRRRPLSTPPWATSD